MKKQIGLSIVLLIGIRVSAGTVLWSESDSFHFASYYGQAQFTWSIQGWIDAYAYCEFYIRNDYAYRPEWSLLARGTNALRMNEGDPVDYSSTFGTDKTYFYGELQLGSTEVPLRLSEDEPLLLGFATVNDGDLAYGEYIYGWIRLIYDGENLQLDSGAVAIGTDVAGIYAGTGIIIPRSIPEPSAAALLALGVAMLFVGRRRGIT